MKNILFYIAIVSVVFSTTSISAKSKYNLKKYDSQVIGAEMSVLQRSLITLDGKTTQKFLDVGYRFSYVKSLNKKVSFNTSLSFTLDQYSLFKTNTTATTNYYHIQNNKLISFSSEYTYRIGDYISMHPRIGMGVMFFEQSHKNEVGLDINSKKVDQLILVGLQGKIHLSNYIALGGSLDYMYSVDALKSNNNQHAYLNAPVASGGLFITFSRTSRKNYCIRCPRF